MCSVFPSLFLQGLCLFTSYDVMLLTCFNLTVFVSFTFFWRVLVYELIFVIDVVKLVVKNVQGELACV